MFPTGTVINPGQVMVIAANANGFSAFYGSLPAFEFANSTSALGNNASVPDLAQKPNWGNAAGSMGIANGGDDVAILTPESTVAAFTFVDGSNHGTVTTVFPGAVTLGSNQSYERVPADADTDSASDWVVRTTGTATPGAVTVPEPGGLALLGAASLGLLARRRRTAS